MLSSNLVFIKGAGDIASGIAHRLHRCGFPLVMTELEQPTVVRRTVSFASAVWEKSFFVEGVQALKEEDPDRIKWHYKNKTIPVFVDPEGKLISYIKPKIFIDATLAKRNLGVSLKDAPIVIGVGPGFTAGKDVHAVIESQRGHNLGKVIFEGEAAPNTGIPGEIAGYSTERVLRVPANGIFSTEKDIGDVVKEGEVVAKAGDKPVKAKINGIIRGLLHQGIQVHKGMKAGDIDPRAVKEYCFTISDKARAVAGGVLEAIFFFLQQGR
jgi:xanthine dehydrogenase accessory factor